MLTTDNLFGTPSQEDHGTLTLMKDPYLVAVGDRLRVITREFGVKSARDLGEIVGSERSAVSNWLNGTALPPVPAMKRLCEHFTLSLDWIYRGDPAGLPTATWIRLSAAMAGHDVPDVQPEETEKPEPVKARALREPESVSARVGRGPRRRAND